MKKWTKFLWLLLVLVVLVLVYKKPAKVACRYSPYFEQLNRALQESYPGSSHALLDLNRLDSNIAAVQQQLGDRFQLRLVAKSLPSAQLLQYLMERAQTNRLMVFSEPFIADLLDTFPADSLDILLGKPLPAAAAARLSQHKNWQTIRWLIDTDARLQEFLTLAQQKDTLLHIALEINVGLQRGGFDTPEKMTKVLQLIKAHPRHLQLHGLMGYDGHVPYVPFYIQREKAIRQAFAKTQHTYNDFVRALKPYYTPEELRKMTFNSGGSRTYFFYKEYVDTMYVNDIAMGSGFLAPAQFPELADYGHQPALYLVSPVLKKIETSLLPHAEKISPLVNWWNPNLQVSYFMTGGGWPGDVVAPDGIQKNGFWDSGEKGYANLLPNQSILSSSDDSRLAVNDFVFTHPWEGDGMLCFSRLLLYRNGKITGEWATYDGGN